MPAPVLERHDVGQVGGREHEQRPQGPGAQQVPLQRPRGQEAHGVSPHEGSLLRTDSLGTKNRDRKTGVEKE